MIYTIAGLGLITYAAFLIIGRTAREEYMRGYSEASVNLQEQYEKGLSDGVSMCVEMAKKAEEQLQKEQDK